ncbi:hypothetical protein IJ103_03410 [Candidatus Saccharibacteria bacterium]|nr:hypothetical protein [Candidatus Saccharibacteria bacterium]
MDNSVEKTPETSARRRNYRPAIFVVLIILLAGVAAFVIALNRRSDNGSGSTETTSSTATKDENEKETDPETKPETKEETSKETEEETPKEEIVEGKTPVNLDQGDASDLDALTGVVNYAASDGQTVMIRVSIDQYLETGECTLDLTTSYDSFNLADAISPSASTSSCSFDISTDLLTGGKYDINVTVRSGDRKGIIKGEVEV